MDFTPSARPSGFTFPPLRHNHQTPVGKEKSASTARGKQSSGSSFRKRNYARSPGEQLARRLHRLFQQGVSPVSCHRYVTIPTFVCHTTRLLSGPNTEIK